MIAIIIYSFVFLIVVFGVKLIDVIKEKELCTCLIKVPFSVLVLASMIITFFYYDSTIDLKIWGPFVGLVTIGNFLIGSEFFKKPIFKVFGIASLILSYVFTSYMMYSKYGVPDTIYLIAIGSLWLFNSMSILYFLDVSLKDNWKEFIYSLFLFTMIAFTAQKNIGQVTPIAVAIYSISELVLQIIRIADSNEFNKVEYDITLIYLLGIVLFIVPKNIF